MNVKIKEINAKRETFSMRKAIVRPLPQKPYILSTLYEDEG
jgi:hypothetical protein